jgi:iron complex outermembrane receptor protein
MRSFAAIWMLGVSVLAAGAAQADDKSSGLETVVVTGIRQTDSDAGTKTDTPILQTPQSVNVITADQIREFGSQSVQQILRYSPGVSSETRGVMTGIDFFYARGFAMDQYLNGLRTLSGGNSFPQPDAYLLESVEVLRGPASILYGQASPGGIVNLVTKQAGADPVNEVQIQAGNYDRIQGGVDLSGDLSGDLDSDGTLSGRIVALAKNADTQVDFAKERRYAVAPSLTWRPNADTKLTLTAIYQDDPHVGYYNWIPAYGTVLPNINGGKLPTSLYTGEPSFDRFSEKTLLLGYSFEHRFNDVFTVRQNFRYANASSTFDNTYVSFLDTDQRTLYRYAWAVNEHTANVDVDTQLLAKFALGALDNTVLAGFDYQNLRYGQKLGYDFDPLDVPPLDIYAPVYGAAIPKPPVASNDVQHNDQFGVYAQDQIAWGNLRVLLGGRQDWVTSSDTQYIDPFTGLPAAGVKTKNPDQHAFTGRAGIVYLFDMGLAPYASYTESFQPQTGTDFAGKPFVPTRGRQYEAGVKYQIPGTQSLFTVAWYDLEQQNVLTTDFAHPGEELQVGAIRSRGFDVWGQFALTDDLDAIASYSHVNQKVTAGSVSFGPPLGAHPSNVPEDQATLWADYRLRALGADGLGVGAGLRYMGRSWGDDNNTFRVSSHTVFDATIHYDFGDGAGAWSGVRLALNATNVFDDKYVAGCGGYDYCAYGFRRTVLATIAKRF